MATNKERIENLEVGLGGLHDNLSRIEIGMTEKLHQMEEIIQKLSDVLLSNREASNSNNYRNNRSHFNRDESRDNSDGGRPIFSMQLAKLEFPRFAGDDPTEWFTRVDQFFEYQGTAEMQKVALASFHLQGEANQWWQWLRKAYKEEGKEVTWVDFHDELWARFGPTECEDFDEVLSRVKQTGSLRDYQKEFERLGNRVQGWTQKALVGTFMGGLKPEIAKGIRMFKPKSLKEVIGLARMKDEQLARQRKVARPIPRSFTEYTTPTTSRAASSMKRLSWDEMQKRRAQGLCFNCDEKFTPGHKCRGPHILLLEANSDPVDEEDIESQIEPQPEISLHAISGWAAYKTMRVMAKIGQCEMIVLIDSGSTHNFISERIANILKLPVIPTEPFTVKVANGRTLQCQGRFENVQVILQGIPFSLTLYALPLLGLDLVLGVHWLKQLGTVVCNWKQLTMEFQWNNERHRLQGIDSQAIQPATIKVISKEIRQGSSMFALCTQTTWFLRHWKSIPT